MKLQISLLVLLILFTYLHKIRENFIMGMLRSLGRPMFSKTKHLSQNVSPFPMNQLTGNGF